MVSSVILTLWGVLKRYKIASATSSACKKFGHFLTALSIISGVMFESLKMFVATRATREFSKKSGTLKNLAGTALDRKNFCFNFFFVDLFAGSGKKNPGQIGSNPGLGHGDLFAGPIISEILLQVNFCGPFCRLRIWIRDKKLQIRDKVHWVKGSENNPGQIASRPGSGTLTENPGLSRQIPRRWAA